LFFNGSFVFIDETYLLLATYGALGTLYFNWQTKTNITNSVLTIITCGIVVIAPFFFYVLYALNYKKDIGFTKKFKKHCAELAESFAIKKRGKITLLFLTISQLRKLLLVVTIIYMNKYPVLSVMFVMI